MRLLVQPGRGIGVKGIEGRLGKVLRPLLLTEAIARNLGRYCSRVVSSGYTPCFIVTKVISDEWKSWHSDSCHP